MTDEFFDKLIEYIDRKIAEEIDPDSGGEYDMRKSAFSVLCELKEIK